MTDTKNICEPQVPAPNLPAAKSPSALRTFQSADGSTRCIGCHLFPDKCMCGHERRIFTALGILCDVDLCEDCPPVGYPTDETRCTPRPRRTT